MKAKQYNSYGDVPFYFQQWFFWIMYLFICPPLALFILVFGNVYYQKNGYVESFGIMNKIVAFFIGIFTCLIWLGEIMVFASTLISTFFSDDFEVRNDIVYKNGELYTGVYQTYYENGNIEFEEEYLNGKAHGHHKNYFQNGNLKSDKLYENNQPNGKSQIFYKTGEIEIEGNYLKGKLNGTLIQFYKMEKKVERSFTKMIKRLKGYRIGMKMEKKILLQKTMNFY